MSIIFIGGGQATGQAVASLQQEGYAGKLTVISDEPWLPYKRPPLSKLYLRGKKPRKMLFVRQEESYQKQNIEFILGQRAESIDTSEQTVRIENGQSLSYSQLILATGSRVRRLSVPGIDSNKVFYLRDIIDSDKMREALIASKKAIIVGGGYIGLEVAASARQLNTEITILEMEERILKRVTTTEMSSFFHNVHSNQGVKIHTNSRLQAIQDDGAQCQVKCADGSTMQADMVVVGAGIVPNMEIANASGIECNNGILVDAGCRTSAPNVWAIGDCTNHPCQHTGTRIRLESVPNAIEQGRVVAANIMGKTKTHDAVPWFWSDQYDLKLQMAGFSETADCSVLRGSEEAKKFVRFHLRDSILVGVDAVNNPGEFLLCKKLIVAKAKLNPSQLADPATDLKNFLT